MSKSTKIIRLLYKDLHRSGAKWVKLHERASSGTKEAPSLLQDLLFRSVKANATQWTESLKSGIIRELHRADKYLSYECKVQGQTGSAQYFGTAGLRQEFKRATDTEGGETLDDRLDAGFTLMRWLNTGNKHAEKILGNLEPRTKPPELTFSVGDIVCHKEYKWRGVVFGWGETATEASPNWREHEPGANFYYLICNDGKLRYADQASYEKVEGPISFTPAPDDAKDANTGQEHLDLFFHDFSNAEDAYIPNAHLARRFPEERWLAYHAETSVANQERAVKDDPRSMRGAFGEAITSALDRMDSPRGGPFK
eukprot:CAMPEP_0173404520 /NCGR_PEP_ID=MMETSP1356-20130122/59587_1 /TAXON_ID=77927 ORGANISM="Hemiselmis virescens, Strain PCC157" /NCGR_SAMPLE_ID=MMETSP1356 /ASSEMBLY_ACC=CAM_ASM_000847 /LENGTH=310 /DNA_ID=CAMNT_0014365217 /DNA_START=79 /DNA_END=1011 /DNA_ORIENTATION=+